VNANRGDEVSTAIPGGEAAGNKLLAGRNRPANPPSSLISYKSKMHAMYDYFYGAR
jgi:hypothetical protein